MERDPSAGSEDDGDDENLWAVCSSQPECADLCEFFLTHWSGAIIMHILLQEM